MGWWFRKRIENYINNQAEKHIEKRLIKQKKKELLAAWTSYELIETLLSQYKIDLKRQKYEEKIQNEEAEKFAHDFAIYFQQSLSIEKYIMNVKNHNIPVLKDNQNSRLVKFSKEHVYTCNYKLTVNLYDTMFYIQLFTDKILIENYENVSLIIPELLRKKLYDAGYEYTPQLTAYLKEKEPLICLTIAFMTWETTYADVKKQIEQKVKEYFNE